MILLTKPLEFFFNYRQQVKLFAGVKRFLRKMSAEIDLGVLTNGNADIKLIGIDKFLSAQYLQKMYVQINQIQSILRRQQDSLM